MIEKFLKAEHWQIFIITFGLPFLIQIILMPTIFIGNDPRIMMAVFPIIMIIFIAGLFGWFWSVGVGLQRKVPSGVIMKVKKFKIFFFVPLIYMLFLLIFMGSLFGSVLDKGNEPSVAFVGGIFAVIFPLHLFSMFCIFYSLYFVAKTFKTVELQREVSFSDFAGEFFMIWFFPIGIWIVQPKINKMIEE